MPPRIPDDEAEQRMLDAGAKPLVPYSNSSTPWVCECLTCGGTVTPTLNNVTTGFRPCKPCALRDAHAETYNARSEEYAARMRDAGLEPLEPYPGGSRDPWRCRCVSCGAEVSPSANNITRGQGGCVRCSSTGFDPRKPAVLYHLSDGRGTRKIGITSNLDRRVEQHRESGFDTVEVVEVVEFEDGADAVEAERAVLASLADAGVESTRGREFFSVADLPDDFSIEDR